MSELEAKEQEKKVEYKKQANWFMFVFIVMVLIGLYKCVSSDPSTEVTELDAEMVAERYVKQLLKSPSTAEFPSTTAAETGDKTFHVDGTVDSQNGFGAMIRNSFECDVVETGSGTLKIENFEMTSN